jgi:hypothetical protein
MGVGWCRVSAKPSHRCAGFSHGGAILKRAGSSRPSPPQVAMQRCDRLFGLGVAFTEP